MREAPTEFSPSGIWLRPCDNVNSKIARAKNKALKPLASHVAKRKLKKYCAVPATKKIATNMIGNSLLVLTTNKIGIKTSMPVSKIVS